MKYLKLFENFDDNTHIEDAKWIVILHLGEIEEVEIDPKWNAKNLFEFELQKIPTEEQIEKCRQHLREEGFFLDINENSIVGITGVGKSLKDYYINWLNENFSNMDIFESKDRPGFILYRYVAKDNVFIYDKKTAEVYINYNKIWSFFESYFSMEYKEIQELTEEWLSEAYNLKGVTTNRLKINSFFSVD